MSLTPEELEIQERCEKATPGDWDVWSGRVGLTICDEKENVIATLPWVKEGNFSNDAIFICEAKSGIPTILSTVSALREEVERLEKALEQAIDYGGITWERVLEPTPTPEYVLERCPVGSDQRPAEVHPELATYLRTKEQP